MRRSLPVMLLLISVIYPLFAEAGPAVSAHEGFAGLEAVSGRWENNSGGMTGISGSGEGVILAPGEYTDLFLEYRVNVKKREGSSVFRYKDKKNCYLLVFSPKESASSQGSLLLLRRVDGRETYFAGLEVQKKPGEWLKVGVRCVGSQIEVYADGRLCLSVEDFNLSSGRAGLRVFGDFLNSCEARYEGLIIRREGKEK